MVRQQRQSSRGLSLASATGLISGTPTETGNQQLYRNGKRRWQPATKPFGQTPIAIAAPPPAPLTVSTSSLPTGTISTSYSSGLQAAGGTSPYTWSITSGTLPSGLTLASTGLISGTPTVSGNFSIGVTVKDAGSPVQTNTATLALSIVAAGPLGYQHHKFVRRDNERVV